MPIRFEKFKNTLGFDYNDELTIQRLETKLWRQIKADVLIEQNKVFQKQIKDIPKDVRLQRIPSYYRKS